MHGPAAVNACDGCHVLKDVATHDFEPARSRNDTCSLCHIVEAPKGEHVHAAFAQGDCLACHDPHGSEDAALLRGPTFADACKTCHQDISGAHDRVHGPVSAGACGACHEPHSSTHPRLLVAEGRDLCLKCHVTTGLELEQRSVVHAPMLGDCLVCHEPHASDQPGILSTDASALCAACHEDIADTATNASTQHAAVTTQRACLNCHAAHASNHAGLLKNDAMSLCFECHNQAISLKDGGTLMNMKQLIERGKSLHGAIAQTSCIKCHEIHGGGHRRLLTNEYPSAIYYPFTENAYALCFSCHDKQMVVLDKSDTATGFRNGNRNLHFVHVNDDKKGRSCSVCHDAHAANRAQHIREEVPFGPGGWKLPIKYESMPDGGRCGAGCHAPYEYNRVKPVTYPAGNPARDWKGDNLVPGVRAQPPADAAKPGTNKP
jgi:predicted CXXCH cytochrome family protein